MSYFLKLRDLLKLHQPSRQIPLGLRLRHSVRAGEALHHCRLGSDSDFEQVSEFHSTEDRQYLLGLIHVEKLKKASWFHDSSVSVVLLPDSITEKEAIISKSLKKVSLQLAGVN